MSQSPQYFSSQAAREAFRMAQEQRQERIRIPKAQQTPTRESTSAGEKKANTKP